MWQLSVERPAPRHTRLALLTRLSSANQLLLASSPFNRLRRSRDQGPVGGRHPGQPSTLGRTWGSSGLYHGRLRAPAVPLPLTAYTLPGTRMTRPPRRSRVP